MFLLLTGCTATGQKKAALASYPVQRPIDIPEPRQPVSDGSVWHEQSEFADLFINPKARRVGDIVTIKITETSSASNSATTGTDRSSTLSGQVEAFFNLENKYLNPGTKFSPFGAVTGGLDSDFQGSGSTSRSNDFSAHITARITEVWPNGNMKVVGTREVQINNENQYITLSGVIRSRDVSSENIILSTYISDAQISYSGAGVVNDRQRPGWMTRVLDKTWPF
jgi:flagellar L-ring protein FlgH